MKFYTKPLLILAIAGIAMTLGSCVSNKKYHTVLAAKDSLEAKNHALQKEMAQTAARFEQKQIEMNTALEADYLKEVRKVDSLQARLKKARVAIDAREASLKELYAELYEKLEPLFPGEILIKREEGKIRLVFFERILFEEGETKINGRGQDAIKNFCSIMQYHPDLNIEVMGHTDNLPIATAPYKNNWELSALRATNVVGQMIQNGLDPTRLIASGRSLYHPAATNKTEEGRKLNRRTEILLIPDFDEDIYDFLYSAK